MADNKGKQFETKFRKDWLKVFPESFILRLNDQVTGYKYTSSNICDFICFQNRNLYLIELKAHKGASLPFENIRQYDLMVQYINKPNIIVCVILWLYEKDIVLYIPISTIKKMKADGEKSVGVRHLENKNYPMIVLPGVKKRIFIDTDYSILNDPEYL